MTVIVIQKLSRRSGIALVKWPHRQDAAIARPGYYARAVSAVTQGATKTQRDTERTRTSLANVPGICGVTICNSRRCMGSWNLNFPGNPAHFSNAGADRLGRSVSALPPEFTQINLPALPAPATSLETLQTVEAAYGNVPQGQPRRHPIPNSLPIEPELTSST